MSTTTTITARILGTADVVTTGAYVEVALYAAGTLVGEARLQQDAEGTLGTWGAGLGAWADAGVWAWVTEFVGSDEFAQYPGSRTAMLLSAANRAE
jgi:hypothetical protein